MIARKIVSLVAALLLTAPVGVLAQEYSAIAPGDRVRVYAPEFVREQLLEGGHSVRHGPPPLVGRLTDLKADSLVVQVGSLDPFVVPLSEVTGLEVSRGKKSNFASGLAFGLFGGAVTGIVVGLASGDDPPENWFAMSAGDKAAAGALLLGAAGGIVGGIIGATTRTERWQEVALDRVRVSVTPRAGRGLAASVSLRL